MKKRKFQILPMTIAAIALTSAMALAGTGIKTGDSALGTVLTNARGMTLYTFDMDHGGKSACYGNCAKKWPPLIAGAYAKADDDFGLTRRKDGAMQWTYYGHPLYLWFKDKSPGDVTGNGVGGVWHAAKAEE